MSMRSAGGAVFLLIKQHNDAGPLLPLPQTCRACSRELCVRRGCGRSGGTDRVRKRARMALMADVLLALPHYCRLGTSTLAKTSLWLVTAWWTHWTGTTCNRALLLKLAAGAVG